MCITNIRFLIKLRPVSPHAQIHDFYVLGENRACILSEIYTSEVLGWWLRPHRLHLRSKLSMSTQKLTVCTSTWKCNPSSPVIRDSPVSWVYWPGCILPSSVLQPWASLVCSLLSLYFSLLRILSLFFLPPSHGYLDSDLNPGRAKF